MFANPAREPSVPRGSHRVAIAVALLASACASRAAPATGATLADARHGPPSGAPGDPASNDAAEWFAFGSAGTRALSFAGGFADVSRLDTLPAGQSGFVRASGGHLLDGHGERLKLFGTNLTADACFPDPEIAPRLAALFRRLGLNAVRLHFIDAGRAPSGLLAADGQTLDPAQLDRMDRLVAEFARAGIYSVFTLHVGRRYAGLDGAAALRFPSGKVLDRFHASFLEAQRDFARRLLTHVNPYTQRSYAAESAVAWIELSNEDTLLPSWGGDARDLPEPYASELAALWHRWLAQRYASIEALRASWRAGRTGPELVTDPSLVTTEDWIAQQVVPTRLDAANDADRRLLRFQAERAGTEEWHLQFHQSGRALHPGRSYVLAFDARSPTKNALHVSVLLDAPDWHNVGVYSELSLSADWSAHRYAFVAHDLSPGHAQLNFSLANHPGVVEISRLTLHEVLAPEAPEAAVGAASIAEVPVPGADACPMARDDWFQFLSDTELTTARAEIRMLREELGVRSLIVNTQANLGGVAGVVREATLSDAIDLHGYWDEPLVTDAPHGVSWSIKNTSQVRATDGGVLGALAAHRVEGRPFSVSEYNTAAPNDAASETLPLLSAIAAFQDWDAIFTYTYLDFARDYDADAIRGVFDLAGHPGRLVFSPAAALVFRRGLVQPARTALTLPLPTPVPSAGPADNALPALWMQAGSGGNAVALHRMQVQLPSTNGHGRIPGAAVFPALAPGSRVSSDTGEIGWDPAGRFTVNAPAVRLVAGSVSGQRVTLGDVDFEFGRLTSRSACVELVTLDERPIAQSQAVLLAVTGRVENEDMHWDARRTSIGGHWGNGPVRAEFVPLSVYLPGEDWHAASLDSAGNRRGRIATEPVTGKTRVKLGGRRSLWYLLTRSAKPAQ